VQLTDFAREAARLQATPVESDPVFRQPSAASKAALGRVRKALMSGQAAAESQMVALARGADGAALMRIALQDKDPRVVLAAVHGATAIAAEHPRLFAFMAVLGPQTPVPLALALCDFHVATHSDAPLLQLVDGLQHPAPQVQQAVLRHIARLAQTIRNEAPLQRLAGWLLSRQGPSKLRAQAVRVLGAQGLLVMSPTWLELVGDADAWVAAEAAVAAVRTNPAVSAKQIESWAARRTALGLATALRIAADDPGPREPLRPLLQSAARSPLVWTDPLHNRKHAIAAMARQVEAHWALH
jgi:hypothetical protein